VILDWLVAALDGLGAITEPLGWLVLLLFVAGAVLERYDRDYARPVVVVAWALFGLFWLSLIHYFAIESRSVVEGLGAVLATPLSLYVGYVLARGRDSLFVLSRAVAVMGLVYVPFVTIEALRRPLIESVTVQTEFLINLLGFQPEVVDGLTVQGLDGETYRISDKVYPYDSTFAFYGSAGDLPITYTIATVCTGIGSMAIFAGLVGAVSAPLDRKLRAFAVSIPVIYALNLVRNVFIAVTFGNQMTNVFPEVVMTLFALESEYMVSYIVSDRILAQVGSVLALVVITWLVVRELPEVLVVIEDLLYLVTGQEYDLTDALDVPEPEPAPELSAGD
jgi:archaeosortase A (PGF-CTERM-specific)